MQNRQEEGRCGVYWSRFLGIFQLVGANQQRSLSNKLSVVGLVHTVVGYSTLAIV